MPQGSFIHRPQTDKGAALYTKLSSEEKFYLAFATSNAPEMGGEPSTVDATYTLSEKPLFQFTRQSASARSFTSFAHRDNKIRLERMKVDGERDWLWLNADYSGIRWMGEIVHWQGTTDIDGIVTENASISVTSEPDYSIKNGKALVTPTVGLMTSMPSDTLLKSTAGTGLKPANEVEYILTTDHLNSTAAVMILEEDNSLRPISPLTDPIDVTVTQGTATTPTKILIKADKVGSCILYIEFTATGKKSDFVTTLIDVTA